MTRRDGSTKGISCRENAGRVCARACALQVTIILRDMDRWLWKSGSRHGGRGKMRFNVYGVMTIGGLGSIWRLRVQKWTVGVTLTTSESVQAKMHPNFVWR